MATKYNFLVNLYALALGTALLLPTHAALGAGPKSVVGPWTGKVSLELPESPNASPEALAKFRTSLSAYEHIRYGLALNPNKTYSFGLLNGLPGKSATAQPPESGTWLQVPGSVKLRPSTKGSAVRELRVASGGKRLVMELHTSGTASSATLQFTR